MSEPSSSDNTKITKAQALRELWSRGALKYKLDKGQKELYELYYSGKHRQMTWLLARRSGKSFALTILAIEQCLRKPNSIVKFLAPTKSQIDTVLRPIFKKIIDDCPEDIRPVYVARQYIYYFKNGSEIQLAGTDNGHAEKLRGGDSDIWIIDEAGSCDDLDYIIKSILLPTTLTTKGKGLISGTPSKTPDHEFHNIIEKAVINGSFIKKTIFDNPRITAEDIKEAMEEQGGESSTGFQREYLCKIIKDESVSVIPEFTDELQKEIIREWPKPPFYDAYIGMDLGFEDLTVLVFGYYDFRAAKIIIEDEIVYDFKKPDMNIPGLTKLIINKEEDLYTNFYTNELKTPFVRVSDIDYIVTNEIYTASGKKINFETTKKDDNDAAINNMRLLLSKKKIIIDPKCTTLIQHLKNVKWKKGKKIFARSQDNGHYDAVDALKYLVRRVEPNKNPYPAHYDLNMKDIYINNKDRFNNKNPIVKKIDGQDFPQLEHYRRLFGMSKGRK